MPDFILPEAAKFDEQKMLFFLQSYKKNYRPSKMCSRARNPQALKIFCEEVESLSFKSEPNYNKLRSILKALIMVDNQQNFETYYEDLLYEMGDNTTTDSDKESLDYGLVAKDGLQHGVNLMRA